MKTILFATDFSRAASKAANYATLLAKQIGAKLILLHANHPNFAYTPDMQAVIYDVDFEQRQNQRKLNRLSARLSKVSDGKVLIETQIKQGFAIDVIVDTVEKIKPNFLIMSAVGQLPVSSKLMGNIASEMIFKTKIPLILIPPKAKFRAFENVFLAIDISKNIDAIALQKVLDSLKNFRAVINVVSITENSENDQAKEYAIKIRELLKDFPHTLSLVKGENFVETFLDFAKKNKADLIVTMPQKHGFFERLFVESNTENLVFKTDLPLISIA